MGGVFEPHWVANARLKPGTSCTYHSADYDTDHSLVCSKARLQPKHIHRSKQQGCPRIGTARVSLPGPRECFAETMENALEDCHTDSATARWNYIRDTMYEAAPDAFGMRERKSEDWFEAGIKELEPAITAKSTAQSCSQQRQEDCSQVCK